MKKPPGQSARGLYGARGIRTPKSFRTLAFEASAIAILPALQTTMPEPFRGPGWNMVRCPHRDNASRVE